MKKESGFREINLHFVIVPPNTYMPSCPRCKAQERLCQECKDYYNEKYRLKDLELEEK